MFIFCLFNSKIYHKIKINISSVAAKNKYKKNDNFLK